MTTSSWNVFFAHVIFQLSQISSDQVCLLPPKGEQMVKIAGEKTFRFLSWIQDLDDFQIVMLVWFESFVDSRLVFNV